MHISGPIERIYTHNEMSYVFSVGLITPLDTSLPNVFSFIFKFSLIFMNMQTRLELFSTKKQMSPCFRNKKNHKIAFSYVTRGII